MPLSGLLAPPSAHQQVASARWRLLRRSLLGTALFLSFALLQSDLPGQSSLITAHTKIKGLVMAVYPETGSEAVATLRANRVFTDHQRRGFFRIGLLPVLVLDGVTIEFSKVEAVTNALANVHDSLKRQTGAAMIELRQAEFRFPAESAPRLKAATIRLHDSGQCQLLSVAFQSAAHHLEAPSAQLQISGQDAGRLSWPSPDGLMAVNLFTLQISTNKPTTIQKPT